MFNYLCKKYFSVSKFIELGASREKIIVGIPTYGRSYTVDSRNVKSPPGVIFTGAGKRGPLTKESGMLGYQEICLFVKNDQWTMVSNDIFKHQKINLRNKNAYYGTLTTFRSILKMVLMLIKVINGLDLTLKSQ